MVPVQTLLASSLAFPKALCIPGCLGGVLGRLRSSDRCGLYAAVQLTGSPTPSLAAAFPERVELDPLPAWQQVGKTLTLRCLVEGGAPRSQLSVVFFQGEEELRAEKLGVNSTNPNEITTTVLASRDNHGANFSCRTELDLRPQGLQVFLNVSEARQLRTFGETPGTKV